MLNKIKLLFIIAFLFTTCIKLCGQEIKDESKAVTKQENNPRKIVYGFNLGNLEFLGNTTFIDISPYIGYYVCPRLLIGFAPAYIYYRESNYNVSNSSNMYSLRVSSIYKILENIGKNLAFKSNLGIFMQTEYESLNLDRDFSNNNSSTRVNRYWLNGILIGGGLSQPTGKISFFNLGVLFNILADKRSPYNNPLIRFGFYF
jgi:hypothetical protein